MSQKIKTQKGFIQIPLLIGIIVSIAVISVGGYGGFEYYKTSKLVKEADQFTKEEKYEEAIEKLNLAQASLLVKNLDIKRQEISGKEEENKKLIDELSKYNQGLDELNKGNLQETIDLLSKFPENSLYYQKAQTKIEEAKRKIVEGELGGEQIARQTAEEETKKEASKRATEEIARKGAEQREATERLAKEQQQRETEIQRQRAEQEEKAGILELAKTHPLVKGIISGELKFYIDSLPSYAAPGVSSAVNDIASVFSSWNPYGISIKRVYNVNNADMSIYWVRDYGSDTVGEAIYQAHVKVGLGMNNCLGQWRAFDANTVKKILWHEIGHSMGYGHSSDPNNVMYYQIATHFEVDHEVSEVIAGGWYYIIPLCSGGAYSYSFQADSPYSGFDIYVLPPSQDAHQISGGSGQYYSSCSAEEMYRYSNSCNVAMGAKIYIGNTSSREAIRLSGEIIDMNDIPWPDMKWDETAFRYDSDELEKYQKLFR